MKYYDTDALLLLKEEAFEEPFAIGKPTVNMLMELNQNYLLELIARDPRIFVFETLADKDEYGTAKAYCRVIATKDDIYVTGNPANYICGRSDNLNIARAVKRKQSIYKGYTEICGDSSYINTYMFDVDTSEWSINQYLIIHNTDDGSTKEMRYDGEKFVSLKLPPSKYIKAKNSLQRCALDILANPDITVAAILGGYGSGKSFLSMRMALYHVNEKGNQSKILGIREPKGDGTAVGYLPGDLADKTDLFFRPLVQQLDGGEFELEMLKQRGAIEATIPYYLKGTTFNDTILLVDEAEDLTMSQIKLIGTRTGENSRIILDGDYKQSVINSSETNALVQMCNKFKGDPSFACIYLGEDVRSNTSRMFAEIQ